MSPNLSREISLRVESEHSSYWPGQTVTCSVELDVYGEPVEIKSLSVFCAGVERRDPLWLKTHTRSAKRLDRSADAPKLSAGETLIFQSATANLITESSLSPGSRRWFQVQVVLPSDLPPSLKGTAVRWSYFMFASAQLLESSSRGGVPATSGPGPATASSSSSSSSTSPVTVTSRKQLRIWPQLLHSAALAANASSPQVEYSESGAELDGHVRWREATPTHVPCLLGPYGGGSLQQQQMDTSALINTAPAWTLGIGAQTSNMGDGGGDIFGNGGGGGILSAPLQPASGSACLSSAPLEELGGSSDFWEHAGTGGTFLALHPLTQAPGDGEERGVMPVLSETPSVARLVDRNNESSNTLATESRKASDASSAPPGAGIRTPSTPPRQPPSIPPTLHFSDFTKGRTYNLSIGDIPIVRVTPRVGEFGETELGGFVAGTLFFHRSEENGTPWRCSEVQITLEMEELIPKQQHVTHSATAAAVDRNCIRKVHDEFHELTYDMTETFFMFSIPSDAEISFGCSLVQVRWLLRFELVAVSSTSQPSGGGGSGSAGGRAGGSAAGVGVHELRRTQWGMPLTVKPPQEAWRRAPETTIGQIMPSY